MRRATPARRSAGRPAARHEHGRRADRDARADRWARRHGGLDEAGSGGDRDRRRPDPRRGNDDGDPEARRSLDARDRPERTARDPGAHRRPRALHGARRVEAADRSHDGAHLGRDRRQGRGRPRARRGRVHGSSATAGIRRSGIGRQCRWSREIRCTPRSARRRRTTRCSSSTRAGTPCSSTRARSSSRGSGAGRRTPPAERSCATRTARRPGCCAKRRSCSPKRYAPAPIRHALRRSARPMRARPWSSPAPTRCPRGSPRSTMRGARSRRSTCSGASPTRGSSRCGCTSWCASSRRRGWTACSTAIA